MNTLSRYIYSTTAAVLTLLLAYSCSNDEAIGTATNRQLLLTLTPLSNDTRSYIPDDTQCFSTGDKVQISMSYHISETSRRNNLFQGRTFEKIGSSDIRYNANFPDNFAASDNQETPIINGLYYDLFVNYPHDVMLNEDDMTIDITPSPQTGAAFLANKSGTGAASDNDLMSGNIMDEDIDLTISISPPSITIYHRLSKVYFAIIKNEMLVDRTVRVRGIAFNSDITRRTWNYHEQNWVETVEQARALTTTVSTAGSTPAERYAARNVHIDFATPHTIGSAAVERCAEVFLLPDAHLTDIDLWIESAPVDNPTDISTQYTTVTIDMQRNVITRQGCITYINLGYDIENIVYLINVQIKKWEDHPVTGSGGSGGTVAGQEDM